MNGLPVPAPEALSALAAAGALLALLGLAVAWSAWRTGRRARQRLDTLEAHYGLVMSGAEGQDLAAALAAFAQRLADGEARLAALEERSEDFEARLQRAVTRLTLLRYKAFEDGGGDQSFVLALLDESADGAVLTGIHGRGGLRLYAKPINAGASRYALTAEESQAIAAVAGAGGDV